MVTQIDIKHVALPNPLSGLQVATLVRDAIEAHNDGEFVAELMSKRGSQIKVGRRPSRGAANLLVGSQYSIGYSLYAYGLYEYVDIVYYPPSRSIVYPSGCSYVDQAHASVERFMRDLVNAWEVATYDGGVTALSIDELLIESL